MTELKNPDVMAVDCPACDAGAGTACNEPVEGFPVFHHLRWHAAEEAVAVDAEEEEDVS